jgi:hypothetical protein
LGSLHKRAGCPFPVELKTFTIAATHGKIRKSRQDDNAEIEMRVQKKWIYGNAQNPRAYDEITRRGITYKLVMVVLRAVWAALRFGVRSSGENQQVLAAFATAGRSDVEVQ